MPVRMTCRSCQKDLHIADNLPGPSVTCPSCLARVTPPTGQVSQSTSGQSADIQATSDTQRTGWGLILLAILGGIGIAYGFVGSVVAAADMRGPGPLIFFGLMVVSLFGISSGLIYLRTGEKPSAVGLGRFLLKTLTLAGFLVLLWTSLCVAVVIFLFAVCLAR